MKLQEALDIVIQLAEQNVLLDEYVETPDDLADQQRQQQAVETIRNLYENNIEDLEFFFGETEVD